MLVNLSFHNCQSMITLNMYEAIRTLNKRDLEILQKTCDAFQTLTQIMTDATQISESPTYTIFTEATTPPVTALDNGQGIPPTPVFPGNRSIEQRAETTTHQIAKWWDECQDEQVRYALENIMVYICQFFHCLIPDNMPTELQERLEIIQALPKEYKDIQYIGTGSYAWLYAAKSTGSQTYDLCIKVAKPAYILIDTLHQNEQELKWRAAMYKTNLLRFEKETNLLASMGHHPYIVAYKAKGTIMHANQQLPYYVMEYCSGGSLRTYLQQNITGNRFSSTSQRCLSNAEAVRWVWQIAQALQYLHQLPKQGKAKLTPYLHRDLKPENILLVPIFTGNHDLTSSPNEHQSPTSNQTPSNDPSQPVLPATYPSQEVFHWDIKLADFGGVKDPESLITKEGHVFGTCEYLAPEQALNDYLDERVDVFALGCILYEMVTGDVLAGKAWFLSKKYEALSEIQDISIHYLCRGMLAPKQLRWKNMQQVCAEIERIWPNPLNPASMKTSSLQRIFYRICQPLYKLHEWRYRQDYYHLQKKRNASLNQLTQIMKIVRERPSDPNAIGDIIHIWNTSDAAVIAHEIPGFLYEMTIPQLQCLAYAIIRMKYAQWIPNFIRSLPRWNSNSNMESTHALLVTILVTKEAGRFITSIIQQHIKDAHWPHELIQSLLNLLEDKPILKINFAPYGITALPMLVSRLENSQSLATLATCARSIAKLAQSIHKENIRIALQSSIPALVKVIETQPSSLETIESSTPSALSALMQYQAVYVKKSIYWALENIGPVAQAAIPALITKLMSYSTLTEERELSVKVLNKINREWAKNTEAQSAIPALIQRLGASSVDKQKHAAEILGIMGAAASSAIPALTTKLTSPSADERILAQHVLDQINPIWHKTPEAKSTIPALMSELTSYYTDVRVSAIEILEKIDTQWATTAEAQSSILTFIQRLASPSSDERKSAAEILEIMGPAASSATPTLLYQLTATQASAEERTLAVRVLDKINPAWSATETAQSAIPDLINQLADTSSLIEKRKSAAEVLDKINPGWITHSRAQSIMADLTNQLEDSSASVHQRKSAAELLTKINPEWISASEGQSLISHWINQVIDASVAVNKRKAAIELLNKISLEWLAIPKAQSVVSALLNQLADYEAPANQRKAAEEVLDKINPEWITTSEAQSAIPAFIRQLTDFSFSLPKRKLIETVLDQIAPEWGTTSKAQSLLPTFILKLNDFSCPVEEQKSISSVLDKINPAWTNTPEAKAILPTLIEYWSKTTGEKRESFAKLLDKIDIQWKTTIAPKTEKQDPI